VQIKEKLDVKNNNRYKRRQATTKDKDGNIVPKLNENREQKYNTYCILFVKDFMKERGIPFPAYVDNWRDLNMMTKDEIKFGNFQETKANHITRWMARDITRTSARSSKSRVFDYCSMGQWR
jgi:hypothetical protein